jgi:predicted TIM-barrel fold metal-dependent hydrolase
MPVIDVHCHLFNFSIVNEYYRKPRINKAAGEGNDAGSFTGCLGIPSGEIAARLLGYYPPGSVIVPLMMDFDFGGKLFGATLDTFHKQILELKLIKARFANEGMDCIFPFLAADPRRPNLLKLVKQLVKPSQAFHGIKVYPPLGYLPSHPVLMEVFSYCADFRIPVTVHCIPDSSIHCRIRKLPVKGIDPGSGAKIDREMSFRSADDCTNYFTDPANWGPVLDRFRNLVLNFGHFGGFCPVKKDDRTYSRRTNKPVKSSLEEQWRKTIEEYIRKYPHVYADLSYIMATIPQQEEDVRLLNRLIDDPVTGNRILYGSDYYMTYLATRNGFAQALAALIRALETRFEKISWINANRFLFSKG